MKQKDISQQLGSLIGQTKQMYGGVTGASDEEIPSELTEPDPIFELDYNKEHSEANKSAYEFMKILVKSVVPEEYQSDGMIVNKMKVDAVQLGMLYYQQKLNDVLLQTCMDTISKGEVAPRMIEATEKQMKRATEISNKITELQNQFRKYYIDSYLDIESKMSADDDSGGAAPERALEQKDDGGVKELSDGSVRTTSTKDVNELLMRRRLEKAGGDAGAEDAKLV